MLLLFPSTFYVLIIALINRRLVVYFNVDLLIPALNSRAMAVYFTNSSC